MEPWEDMMQAMEAKSKFKEEPPHPVGLLIALVMGLGLWAIIIYGVLWLIEFFSSL